MSDQTHVLLLYGGRSSEHEVSCRSAAFVLKELLKVSSYKVHLVGITKDGRWFPQNIKQEWSYLPQGEGLPIVEQFPASWSTKGMHESSVKGWLYSFIKDDVSSISKESLVVFPLLHGTHGEDGTMQGLCELAQVAYVGSDYLGSAIAMDKAVSKELVLGQGIHVGPFCWFSKYDWLNQQEEILSRVTSKLKKPYFVKPCSLGSSIGISKVKRDEDLVAAINEAFIFDRCVIVEEGITGRELECAVLGSGVSSDTLKTTHILAEVIAQTADFYTYEAKYLDEQGARLEAPAKVPSSLVKRVQEASITIFRSLRLDGMARIDFFYDELKDIIYFNEANTIPGFTSISQYPHLWKLSGVEGSELCQTLIQSAIKSAQEKAQLKRNRI